MTMRGRKSILFWSWVAGQWIAVAGHPRSLYERHLRRRVAEEAYCDPETSETPTCVARSKRDRFRSLAPHAVVRGAQGLETHRGEAMDVVRTVQRNPTVSTYTFVGDIGDFDLGCFAANTTCGPSHRAAILAAACAELKWRIVDVAATKSRVVVTARRHLANSIAWTCVRLRFIQLDPIDDDVFSRSKNKLLPRPVGFHPRDVVVQFPTTPPRNDDDNTERRRLKKLRSSKVFKKKNKQRIFCVVLASQRTGSSWFLALLNLHMDAHFRQLEPMLNWSRGILHRNGSRSQYIATLDKAYTKLPRYKKLVGFKLMWDQISVYPYDAAVWCLGKDARTIHIERRVAVLSYVSALQTKDSLAHVHERADLPPSTSFRVDTRNVSQKVLSCHRAHRSIEAWASAWSSRWPNVHVYYEDLTANTTNALAALWSFLGLKMDTHHMNILRHDHTNFFQLHFGGCGDRIQNYDAVLDALADELFRRHTPRSLTKSALLLVPPSQQGDHDSDSSSNLTGVVLPRRDGSMLSNSSSSSFL